MNTWCVGRLVVLQVWGGGEGRGVRAADSQRAGQGQNVKDFENPGAWTPS